MVSIPDEMLMAYADGELTAAERQAMEQLLGQDAALRARLEPYVETRLRLAYAFEHMLHEPLPDRLVAAIAVAGAQQPHPGPAARAPGWHTRLRDALAEAFAATFPNGMSPLVAASAASLLLVAGTAGWIGGRVFAPSGMIEVTDAGLVASGSLANALESLPSGASSPSEAGEGSVTPVLSFRSQTAGICREYRITGGASASDFAGLACRTADGDWQLALHVETPKPEAAQGPYQTATSTNIVAVDALTGSLIAGDAFGRDDEAKLLANGWEIQKSPAGAR
jgi:surface antigen